ncbi:hypothetical protein [Streptomyces montanisoli]|uniref:LigA protein n=1 Tax=Streptomyces montanisoli TaxID=2798581 RepID=A0A940MC25_9ACTN|nr:hypothetical protein [Streptomyces montanisoli]MBP0456256.1 hypothetical protein [Streptomyces montanisoli]
MTVRSAWLLPGGTDSPGQTREDTRLAPVGTMLPDGELGTRPGVIPGGDPFAATGAGAMSLQVATGRAQVQGTAAQGAYPVCLDAPEVVTFADGDAQFDRIDTVCLHVYDALFDTAGQNLAAVEVIVGSATDTPTAPTLDPACLPLWDVRVPAGASAGVGGIDWTSALTDRRRYTAAVGGIVPRGALSDVGAYDGQYADVEGLLYRWSTADDEWQLYRAPELPVETITDGADTATGWTLNSFDARRHGRVVQILGYWVRSGETLTTNPNIADTLIATLPTGWRPVVLVEAIASNGYGFGAVAIGTDGKLTVRSWAGGEKANALEKDTNVRVAATFVQ